MKRDYTRFLIVADPHCGHVFGLTPPRWQLKIPGMTDGDGEPLGWRQEAGVLQGEMYDWFTDEVDALRPIDVLIANADMIDGKGSKSGSTEQIESDRREQVKMATTIIKSVRAKKVYMTYGTPYHTGQGEDWEEQIAENVGATIRDQLFIEANGLVISVKHQVGRSSTPYGGHTPLAKEAILGMLAAARDEEPGSDIIIRSHTHQFKYAGEKDWLAYSTPSLQAHSKYGQRRVTGGIDIGITWIDIHTNGTFTWGWKLAELEGYKPEVFDALV